MSLNRASLTLTRTLSLTVALTLLAGHALAATDPGDALKGPDVPTRTTPDGATSFGEQNQRNREVNVPLPAFMRMLREATGPEAPENLRASDAQKEQIEKISTGHMDAMRKFMDENREKVEAFAKQHPEAARMLREAGLGGQGPGGRGERGERRQRTDRTGAPRGDRGPAGEGDPMMAPPEGGGRPQGDRPQGDRPAPLSDADRQEMMAKLKELRDAAPKAEDAKTAIWAVLTGEQQAAVQTRVDAFKKQALERRDQQYKEREAQKLRERMGDGNKDGAKPAREGNREAPPKLDDAKRAEVLASLPKEAQDRLTKMPKEAQDRILGRLSTLPAEERAEALQRMAERMREGGNRQGRGQRGNPDGQKREGQKPEGKKPEGDKK
ncbi:MAG: hypothetical protein MUE97_02590 [Phycisphaerales bacterium]|jgi:hypothetical protein|nr:hypothetical protein [Phycisphaerales bacterium]